MTKKIREYMRRRYREELKPAYDEFMKVYPFTLDDLDGEVWRTVPAYEDYQVSNYGRVKSFVRYEDGKILKPSLHIGGRLLVRLGRNVQKFIHVLVAEAFIPNLENKPQVDHINGDKLNACANNLRWVTKLENEQYSWQTGLREVNERHHNAKLTAEQTRYIRENPDNLTGKVLALKFGVSCGTISGIQTGQKRVFDGGSVRKSKTPPSLPIEIKNQIRTEYRKGVRGFGTPALAKKFGVSHTTIQRIVDEK